MKISHIQHIGLGSRNIGLRFARYAEYDMFYAERLKGEALKMLKGKNG